MASYVHTYEELWFCATKNRKIKTDIQRQLQMYYEHTSRWKINVYSEIPTWNLLTAAVINIWTLAIYLITMCNMKGVAHKEKATKNYHPVLQFISALRSILASFSTLYLLIYCPQCNRNGFPNTLVSLLWVAVGCCFLQKALKTDGTLHARHQAAGRHSQRWAGAWVAWTQSWKEHECRTYICRTGQTWFQIMLILCLLDEQIPELLLTLLL